MGRTLPTFNMLLEQEMETWQPFRRALDRPDRERLDRLFAMAKQHMAEAANVARTVPFDAFVLSILLEQQKQIEALREQLAELRKNSPPPPPSSPTSST